MLNCKIGEFPMKYLGLPISDRHLGAQSFWGWVIEKMRKKIVPPGKGRNFLRVGG